MFAWYDGLSFFFFFFAFYFLGSRLHRFRTLVFGDSHQHMIHYIVQHSCWCPTLYVFIVLRDLLMLYIGVLRTEDDDNK